MQGPLLQLNEQIKQEADTLLYEKELLRILSAFGLPHVSGSYALDLMTWRDLDIYLEAAELSETDFFTLGGILSTLFKPVKMSFRNERIAQTPGLPSGLYWGVYLGNERAGAWKIDLWAVEPDERRRLLQYVSALEQQLDPEKRLRILEIKSACWQDPGYRRSYSSSDIYRAVLEENISGLKGFREYLNNKK